MSRRLPVLSRLSTGASTATVINAVDPENRLGRVVMNPPRALMEDLDSLPFPAWDLIPIAKYTASTWFPNKVKQYVKHLHEPRVPLRVHVLRGQGDVDPEVPSPEPRERGR
jgi:hypothetical protein